MHTAFEFIGKFIKQIKIVNFYGFILNKSTHENSSENDAKYNIEFYKNKTHESCTKHDKFKNSYKIVINKISQEYQLPL